MSNKCWPWNHAWSKWQTIEQGKLMRTLVPGLTKADEGTPIGTCEYQRRVCETCGKAQLREVIA